MSASSESGVISATKGVKELLMELKHSFWLPPFSVMLLLRIALGAIYLLASLLAAPSL